MPEGETRQSGSWLGDLTNEWKTAKPPEKIIIVLAIVATVGIALYLHGKSQAPNQPGASGLAGIPANFQQGASGGTTGGTTAPVSNPTQPPTTTPTAPTTPPKKGTPGPAPKPAPKPAPLYPVRPIIKQPTTTTKTYASTNHATSAPKIYMQHQAPNYTYNRNSTYEVARGRATYGTPSLPKPPQAPGHGYSRPGGG